ncbi:MAG: hypothetical protein HQK79_22105 [Desulfobacterales bacterium]|nr:hypothetical protein [Desulfobacterales bacterium]
MKIKKRQYISIFQILIVTLFGCATTTPLPSAKEPTTMITSIDTNYDVTWDATLQTIYELHGIIIFQSKELGFISFHQQWGTTEKAYYNIYVQHLVKQKRVMLYYSSWIKGLANMNGRLFFEKIKECISKGTVSHSYAKQCPTCGINIPDIETIKRDGKSISLDAKSNELWEAMIIVLMQKATIFEISKIRGFLLAPPYLLLVESNDKVNTLYSYFMATNINLTDREYISNYLLSQIVMQLTIAEKISFNGRWSYLY